MLTIDVAQLYTVVPVVFRRHLALPELHDDVHRTDTIADVIGEVRADTEAGTDTPLRPHPHHWSDWYRFQSWP